jgi:DNA-binding NarL/FixJ family response regulator
MSEPESSQGEREMGAIRVLLADDEELVRFGLRTVLEAGGIEVVGEAGDGAEAVALAGELCPDVVLMDVRMPGMDGFEATREIKVAMPTVQVVFVTAYEDPHPTQSAAESGAYAYLLKDSPPELMGDLIHRAAQTKHELEIRDRREA